MDFVSLTKTKINNGINKIFLSAITFAHRKALRYQLLTNWHICNAISIQNSSNYSAFTWNWALSFLLAHSHWSTVNTQDEKYKNLSSQWKIETNTPNDEFMIYYTHKCSSLNDIYSSTATSKNLGLSYIQAWKQIISNCFIFVVKLSTMVLNRDRVAVPRFYDELWMDWAGDYLLLLYLLYTTLGWINLAWWKCMNILHNCTIFYSAQQVLSSQCDITVL